MLNNDVSAFVCNFSVNERRNSQKLLEFLRLKWYNVVDGNCIDMKSAKTEYRP